MFFACAYLRVLWRGQSVGLGRIVLLRLDPLQHEWVCPCSGVTLHDFTLLTHVGCLDSAPSSSDQEAMHLFAGSAGMFLVANSMQYLVLLPGLALVDRGKLFTVSRACGLQRWSPRKTIPKPISKGLSNLS